MFLPILLVSLPYYGLRMARRGGYRHDFHHRLGLIDRPRPKQPNGTRIWVQAVSVGEVKALGPLLQSLEGSGAYEVVLTTTTSTGYKLARELYGGLVMKTGIFPLDFLPFSRSAWRRLDPDLVILMESELWPEHMHQARLRNVPVMLINGRISDRSFHRYQRFKRTAYRLVNMPSRILASSEQDRDRFIALGANPQRVEHTGNLKFDVRVDPLLNRRERDVLKHDLGLESHTRETRSSLRPPLVLLGSSTWPGEEQLLISIIEEALAAGINVRCLIVPRHAERRGELRAIMEQQKRQWHLRSEGGNPKHPVRFYLADTTGELTYLSQVADVAFIGKSMPPNAGGQTPIEAAALGIPIIYGPNMNNFRQICRSLEQVGAARRVGDDEELRKVCLDLLSNKELRQQMSEAARVWHASNQGATGRTLAAIGELGSGPLRGDTK